MTSLSSCCSLFDSRMPGIGNTIIAGFFCNTYLPTHQPCQQGSTTVSRHIDYVNTRWLHGTPVWYHTENLSKGLRGATVAVCLSVGQKDSTQARHEICSISLSQPALSLTSADLWMLVIEIIQYIMYQWFVQSSSNPSRSSSSFQSSKSNSVSSFEANTTWEEVGTRTGAGTGVRTTGATGGGGAFGAGACEKVGRADKPSS